MGAQKSKRLDVPTQLQMSEAQVKRLLDAEIKEYERKRQEEAFVTAQRKLQEVAASIAAQRKLQEEAFITAQRKLQEETAILAAQKKLQEETFIAAQRKLQEEAAKVATQRKLQEEAAKAATQRILQEEAVKAATQRKLQEEAAKAATQRKLQEEAAKAATQRNLQEEAAKAATQRKLQEEAAKAATQKKLQDQANKKKQQEEVAKRKQQEAAQKKQEDVAKKAFQDFLESSLSAFEEEAAKKKQHDDGAMRISQEAAATSYLKAPVPVPRREPFPRSRLVSRHQELPREADVLRYCSTCYTRSIMKMFKCENGHGSCDDCKIKGRACGICRNDLTNRRSYDIENNVAQTIVPCPHAWQGCVLHIKIADMDNHVQECPFKEQVCPLAAVFGNCRWHGQISELSSHFADMHPNLLQTEVDSEFHVRNIHRDYRYICLVELGYHFIFHQKISKNDSKVYMAVQLIGTKISAKKWLYEVHVYNKSENRRKYIYTGNCRSSIDDMDEVFRSGECAVLPMWYANTFVNNKALTFKFFIKRTYENRKGFDRNQRGRDYFGEEEKEIGWSGSCTSLTDERDIRQRPREWVNSRLGRIND